MIGTLVLSGFILSAQVGSDRAFGDGEKTGLCRKLIKCRLSIRMSLRCRSIRLSTLRRKHLGIR